MKYKIAIVDDEQEVVAELTSMINKFADENNEEFIVSGYKSGDEFLTDRYTDFDIVFIDINMPGKNGLQIAKILRAKNQSVAIIFSTHYAQYATKGYEVEAVGYLVKPIDEPALNKTLIRALNVLRDRQKKKISLKTLLGTEIITVNDIVYIEVKAHDIFYYVLTKDGVEPHRARGVMKTIVQEFSDYDFIQCSSSYLVNLKHITCVKNKEVFLSHGIVVPISRNFVKSFSDGFLKYIGSKSGGGHKRITTLKFIMPLARFAATRRPPKRYSFGLPFYRCLRSASIF